ncbi:MAG: polysaccharide biosynthesis/export protein [Sphingomonadales bacterium]|nr:polysaccharide biosynthesis/export protein [Sphingomonadales bacterium]
MQELRHVSFRLPLARAAASLVLIGAALAMSACTRGRGGPVAYDPPDFVAPDAQSVVATAVQQRIGPLDKIRVTVFQVADMTGEYTVDASGNIEFPLLGTVNAQGLLPAELGQRLAERLGQRYLRSPSVTVTMLQQAEQTITVDGAVRQPGVVPIRGSTTLMQAVALGRGTAEDANINRVVVFRTINGQRMAAAFDLQAIRRGQSQDPAIYGNDIVVVDGSRTRGIWRDIIGAIPLVGIFAPYIAR